MDHDILAPVTLALALHMLTVGYSFGSDWVVDQLAFFFTRSSEVTPQYRAKIMRQMLIADQHPRMGMILMIGSGFTYEILAGLSPFGTDMLPIVWAITAIWFIEIWVSFLNEGKSWGHTLVNIDVAWRYLLGGAFLVTGVWSLFGGGFYPSGWMSLKYTLFGLCIGGGVSVRFAVRELQAAWPGYMQNGSTPEFEEILNRCMFRAIYVTWSIWVMYAIMAVLLITQPF